MTPVYSLSLPLTVQLGRKTWNVNLNEYRRSRWPVLCAAKKKYEAVISQAVFADLDRFKVAKKLLEENADNPLHITLTLYPATNRSIDVTNVCAVSDKFACDALVAMELLPDDDSSVISSVEYRFGGKDAERPRVDLEIFLK